MRILHTFVILLHGLFPCSSARKLVCSAEKLESLQQSYLGDLSYQADIGLSLFCVHRLLTQDSVLFFSFYLRACATIHFDFCSAPICTQGCACLACALLITEYRVQDPCCKSGISFCFLGFGGFLLLFPHSPSCNFTDPGVHFLFPSKKNNNRNLSSSLPCSSSEIPSF